jgi:hypothetical protein
MKNETYTVTVKCDNCETVGTADVPRGHEVPKALECKHCGCKKAHKYVPPKVERPPDVIPVPVPRQPAPPVFPQPVMPHPDPWIPNPYGPRPYQPMITWDDHVTSRIVVTN